MLLISTLACTVLAGVGVLAASAAPPAELHDTDRLRRLDQALARIVECSTPPHLELKDRPEDDVINWSKAGDATSTSRRFPLGTVGLMALALSAAGDSPKSGTSSGNALGRLVQVLEERLDGWRTDHRAYELAYVATLCGQLYSTDARCQNILRKTLDELATQQGGWVEEDNFAAWGYSGGVDTSVSATVLVGLSAAITSHPTQVFSNTDSATDMAARATKALKYCAAQWNSEYRAFKYRLKSDNLAVDHMHGRARTAAVRLAMRLHSAPEFDIGIETDVQLHEFHNISTYESYYAFYKAQLLLLSGRLRAHSRLCLKLIGDEATWQKRLADGEPWQLAIDACTLARYYTPPPLVVLSTDSSTSSIRFGIRGISWEAVEEVRVLCSLNANPVSQRGDGVKFWELGEDLWLETNLRVPVVELISWRRGIDDTSARTIPLLDATLPSDAQCRPVAFQAFIRLRDSETAADAGVPGKLWIRSGVCPGLTVSEK